MTDERDSSSFFGLSDADLMRALETANNELAAIKRETLELAHPNNDGRTTAIESTPLPRGELRKTGMTKRAFVLRSALVAFGSTTLAGAVGGVAATLISDAIKRPDPDTGRDIYDKITRIELDPHFLTLVEKERENIETFVENVQKRFSEKEHKLIVNFIERFDRSYLAFDRDINRLKQYLEASRNVRTKFFIADLITAEYVRLGRGIDARQIIDSFEARQFDDVKQKITYMEKVFSSHYTSLTRKSYLNVADWKVDGALESFNDTVGASSLKMEIAKNDNGLYSIRKAPTLEPKAIKAFRQEAGRVGFYLVFWVLHYLAAFADAKTLAEISAIEYRLLKLFAHPELDLKMDRAVWNALFIGAMQLERRGARRLRNKFIAACFGDPAFWRRDPRGSIDARMGRPDDIVPICFCLFVNARSEFRSAIHNRPKLRLERLEAIKGQIFPQSLVRSVDMVRKVRAGGVNPEEAFRDYLVGDGTLGVYLDDPADLREALRHL